MPEAFCGLETVRKNAQWTLCALWEIKLPSVREKTPQQVTCVSSHRVGAFYFSQKNTDEQNTQHFTETLSQPISQNLTANISWNVLWILYAGGVLWVRNCAQKGSVKSVRSVREKTHQRVVCVLYHTVGAFYFSQKNTEEQNTQGQKDSGPSPLPLPRREGEWSPRYPCEVDVCLDLLSYWQSCRGNLTYYAPPCGGGVGGGATILWARNVGWKGSVNSVDSVREKNIQHKRKDSPHPTQAAR